MRGGMGRCCRSSTYVMSIFLPERSFAFVPSSHTTLRRAMSPFILSMPLWSFWQFRRLVNLISVDKKLRNYVNLSLRTKVSIHHRVVRTPPSSTSCTEVFEQVLPSCILTVITSSHTYMWTNKTLSRTWCSEFWLQLKESVLQGSLLWHPNASTWTELPAEFQTFLHSGNVKLQLEGWLRCIHELF